MACRRRLVGVAFWVYGLIGCGSGHPAASGPQGLFEQHCARCHAQAGEPGGPKIGSSKGPNLSQVGSKRGRTSDWLADYIRDPKSKDPGAKGMPGFEGKLTEAEIVALSEWLAAKK